MPKPSNKSDQTKASMMRAAIQLFSERGFAGCSLRDIANQADVNIGLIRYHFGSKADLYRDTLAHVSEPYNRACLAALEQARASGSVEQIIFSWLAAPYTHWEDGAILSGEELLCFLNKMGYESTELTHEVYASHYSFAHQEWKDALQSYFPNLERPDWLWCLTCLRGMYFNVVAHNEFALWGLPAIRDKEHALRRLASDMAALLHSYEHNELTPKNEKKLR